MAITPKDLLLGNKWTAFFSTEPNSQFRSLLEVSFSDASASSTAVALAIHFKSTALFSELGLGDDVVLSLISPVTVYDAYFNVPVTITKTGNNPQGQSARLQLTGQDYGFAKLWGSHQMAMLGRVYSLRHP